MKYFILIVHLFIGVQLFGASTNLFTGNQISKQEYVSKWSRIAVEQMIQHNIPASITLAQGILESGSGNSELALKANNHFGIKCHDWTGEKFFKDDDTKNECFRVYPNADESFLDHSKFLTGRQRYAKLFTYERTDYKSWANGLKEAGYATNPKYPELLIRLIEELNLNQYDEAGGKDLFSVADLTKSKSKPESTVVVSNQNTHTVYNHSNKVKYVVVKKGDTFYRISKEFGLSLKQLYRYNDFNPKKDILEEGDIVHIQPKRAKATDKSKTYKVDRTLLEISQEEGIRIKSLLKLNPSYDAEGIIQKGEKVMLR